MPQSNSMSISSSWIKQVYRVVSTSLWIDSVSTKKLAKLTSYKPGFISKLKEKYPGLLSKNRDKKFVTEWASDTLEEIRLRGLHRKTPQTKPSKPLQAHTSESALKRAENATTKEEVKFFLTLSILDYKKAYYSIDAYRVAGKFSSAVVIRRAEHNRLGRKINKVCQKHSLEARVPLFVTQEELG